ncbi:MAG TPA: ISL3 family transposase [Bacillales bacterium]|nr:ISL3 family transposase [Bacillales bacterium]
MHSHFTNLLIDLKELSISNIENVHDQFFIYVQPNDYLQPCPQCQGKDVIRKGSAYLRKVRHLPAFGHRVFLFLPAIRMMCKDCDASFVWQYECVASGKRYTKQFEASLPGYVVGATVTHAARQAQTPATTVERIFKRWMEIESIQVQATCKEEALKSSQLVLGIDDFAIRKGHTYNTGLHDLRGGSFLDVIPGRTLEELHSYYQKNPLWVDLKPTAVVMDLAKGYHTFIKEIYPNAIRIADRFHVNRYVTEALQLIRKQVQKDLSTRARQQLKLNYRLLGKRSDQLSKKETILVNQFLQYSDDLRAVYEWKEAFITWYDCSVSHALAEIGFVRWLKQGEIISHPAVQECLKTMKNWQEEICNYHLLRFTNAAVEGRNNKIKALQRRHYFTRNPKHYKQRILLECNEEQLSY